jgi:hypothetical protein
MEPLDVLHNYGWAGVIMYLTVKELWPFLKEKLFPAYVEEKKRRAEQTTRDRERLEKLEERQVTAFEQVAQAVNVIKETLAVNNERLNNIHDGVKTLLGHKDKAG